MSREGFDVNKGTDRVASETRLLEALGGIRDELRGIRYAIEAHVVETAEDQIGPACPSCGERDPEKLEDTSATRNGRPAKRITCLSCGKSNGPGAEGVGNG